jgi:hypothetical protein
MHVAVQCNEDVTFASSRDFVVARDKNRRASPLAHIITFNEAYLDVCAAWLNAARSRGQLPGPQ